MREDYEHRLRGPARPDSEANRKTGGTEWRRPRKAVSDDAQKGARQRQRVVWVFSRFGVRIACRHDGRVERTDDLMGLVA